MPRSPLDILLWPIIGVLLLPLSANAELIVIYDSGNTHALAPLLGVLAVDEPPVRRPEPHVPDLGAADLERLLPIQSPGLTPGRIERRAIDAHFARPFFLIGSDPLSRRWLAAHREELLRIGAAGMVVQAQTLDDLRAVAKLAGGLPILPAPASDVAQALGLSHYPVLISGQGIEQ